MTARPDPLGLAAAATTALTWGLVGTMVRLLPALTPTQLVAGRLLFALAAALPALGIPAARTQLAQALRTPAAWTLATLLGGYYLLAVAAFRLAPVADVALLLATAPLCALGLRRLTGAPVAVAERNAALVALAGVALTLVPSIEAALAGAHDAMRRRLAGDALALGAAGASAAYALRFRAAQLRARPDAPSAARRDDAPGVADASAAPSPFGVAVLTFALGGAVLAARAALRGEPVVGADRLDARGLALLAALGILSTLVPTLAFAAAARRLPPVLTAAAQLLVPPVAALAAALALGERPSVWLAPGGVLVAVGLLRLLRVASA